MKTLILILALGLATGSRGAQNFDGSSQSASASVDLSANTVISVSMWVDVVAFGITDQVVFELTGDSLTTAGGLGFVFEGAGTMSLFACGSGGGFGNSTAAVYALPSAGASVHIVVTCDHGLGTNQLNLWLNGVLQTPTGRPLNNNTSGSHFASATLYFGARTNSTKWYGGRIEGMAIYGESLAAGDIKSLAQGLSPAKVRPSQLLKWWMFDNGLIETKSSNSLTNNGSTSVSSFSRLYR